MATMIAEVYDALIAAGAPEEKARKAAEAIAGYESRFGKVDGDISLVRGDVNLVKWMVGFNIALTVGVLLRLLS